MNKLIKLLLFLNLIVIYTANAVNINWQEKIVKLDDKYKMHYYYAGHGAPVILLNGYGVTANFWSASFVNCLASNHTVYLIDYRGIGTNEPLTSSQNITDMANDIHSLVKALDIKKPDIIAWSMGSTVAIQLSYKYPDNYNKIVLLAPVLLDNNLNNEDNTPEFKNQNQILNYVFNNNLYDYKFKDVLQYKNKLFKPDGVLFPTDDVNTNQLMAIAYWINSDDTEDKILSSNSQYLLIVANHDKILSKDKTLSDATEFKNIKVVEFDGSGHDISLQAPILACKQIESFIKSEKQ